MILKHMQVKRCFICVFIFLFSLSATAMTEQDKMNWLEDLSYYEKILPRLHINPFDKMTHSEFKNRIDLIRKELNNKTNYQVIVDLMRLHRAIGDGHTSIPLWQQKIHSFPIELLYIENKFRVVKTTEKYSDLLGAELSHIGSHPVEKLQEMVREVAPFIETPASADDRVASYMLIAELLVAFGVLDDLSSGSFTFHRQGQNVQIMLPVILSSEKDSFIDKNILPWEKRKDESSDFLSGNTDTLWYKTFKQHRTLYIRFKRYPKQNDMDDFGEEVLKVINRDNIINVVIDFRENSGGDLFVGLTLARWINLADSVDWLNGVYVLVGRKTFSASMANAMQYRQLLNAKIIGEQVGAIPAGYQDMGTFELPNSKLLVTYSKRRFDFSVSDINKVPLDKEIILSWESVLNGEDQVFEWVLRNISTRIK